MAKLTKKQRKALLSSLDDLTRAFNFIHKQDVAVARKSTIGTTELHYTRDDSSLGPAGALYEIDKYIGSDLTGLGSGLDKLMRFLGDDAKAAYDKGATSAD